MTMTAEDHCMKRVISSRGRVTDVETAIVVVYLDVEALYRSICLARREGEKADGRSGCSSALLERESTGAMRTSDGVTRSKRKNRANGGERQTRLYIHAGGQ